MNFGSSKIQLLKDLQQPSLPQLSHPCNLLNCAFFGHSQSSLSNCAPFGQSLGISAVHDWGKHFVCTRKCYVQVDDAVVQW